VLLWTILCHVPIYLGVALNNIVPCTDVIGVASDNIVPFADLHRHCSGQYCATYRLTSVLLSTILCHVPTYLFITRDNSVPCIILPHCYSGQQCAMWCFSEELSSTYRVTLVQLSKAVCHVPCYVTVAEDKNVSSTDLLRFRSFFLSWLGQWPSAV
jgi:hypothetical protein